MLRGSSLFHSPPRLSRVRRYHFQQAKNRRRHQNGRLCHPLVYAPNDIASKCYLSIVESTLISQKHAHYGQLSSRKWWLWLGDLGGGSVMPTALTMMLLRRII